jgi:hypothetical protein
MSNELNISELYVGTIDGGWTFQLYMSGWDRNRVRIFNVVPDSLVHPPGGGLIQIPGGQDLEVTRTWSTTWTDPGGNQVLQSNMEMTNPGPHMVTFHVLVAETDN